jgi:hypothetical protein
MFTLIAVMNSFFIEVEICGHGKLETFESNELFIYHHKLNSIHIHNSNEEKYTNLNSNQDKWCTWSI